MEPA
jgi:hypothetical protein